MAKTINPSKLLPSAKSTAIVRVGKPNIIAKTSPLSKGLLATRQSKDATDANNKLVKVDKFLKSDLIVSQKKAEVKRKDTEKEDFAEAEKKLELPKFKGIKLPGISLPSLGFMDRVKRFIFFTALGWALPKILEFLPKLEGFANIIGGVYNFAEGLFGKLFDGFMSLVKFGGDLKDKTLGFIATAKAGVGGNYQKEFDKLEKQFNTFVNASIIAGVLSADIGLAAEFLERKLGRKLTPQELKEFGVKPGSVEGRAIQRPGTKAERAAAKQQKRIQGAELRAAAKKPKPKPSLWQKLTGGLKSKFAGVAGKLAKPFSKFAGAAIPGLGAAIGFADAQARSKSGDKLGAFLAGLSASLDAFTAAVAVAGLASAATGVGLPAAAVLATAATAAGAISMSIDVVLLIRDILKAFGVPVFNKGGRVVRKYQGGGNTRGGRPVGASKRRGITPATRKIKQTKPPKSQPGRDVGGENKIKRLYPNTGKRFITEQEWRDSGSTLTYNEYLVQERQNEGKKPNPYKALTSTAKILKEIPLVGGIMGAAVDIALGQKPDVNVYRSLSAGIGSLVESLANQKTNQSVTSLMRNIKGFAEGGKVPASRELKGDYRSLSSGDMIAKVLGPTIDQRVNEAIQSIQKELQKRKEGAPGQPPGQPPGPSRTDDGAPPGDYDSGKTGSYASGAYIGEPGDTDGQQTGLDMNLSGGIGTPIYAPRDLIYRSKGTDGNPSVGLNGTPDVLGPSGSGFGYYGAYYFKEGNKEYEVLMGHFRDTPYKGSKDGQVIPKGTLLGYQGASGRTIGAGGKPYPHISLHLNGIGFSASNQKLVEFADSLVKSGGTKAKDPPSTAKGTSIASWYGPDFYGNQTADNTGKYILKRDSLWVAHKTLPFGTRVKFTYNGKTITLPVRDRGPFEPGRDWDLTEAAAEQIGLKTGSRSGTGSVQYEILGKQGGGLISPRKPNRPIPNSFASYETYGSGMMIAIQPIIVEKQVPVSGGGNKMIAFPVPVAVNSNIDNAFIGG